MVPSGGGLPRVIAGRRTASEAPPPPWRNEYGWIWSERHGRRHGLRQNGIWAYLVGSGDWNPPIRLPRVCRVARVEWRWVGATHALVIAIGAFLALVLQLRARRAAGDEAHPVPV